MWSQRYSVDGAGNLFIADARSIRKVDPSGIITTFAGNGTHGFSGDGGPATDASLGSVSAIAVDGAGNLFIADTRGALRSRGPDGAPLMLLEPRIRKVDTSGIITTVAIRKVDASGIITTVAGNGTSGFSGDGGPATNALA